MSAAQGERTEQPTPRRLQQARKEGRFAVSRDFVHASHFFAFVVLASALAPAVWAAGRAMMRGQLRRAFEGNLTLPVAGEWAWEAARQAAPLAAAGLSLAVLALVSHLTVTRFGLATAKLAPDWKRLNPAPRLRSMAQQNLQNGLIALLLLPLFGAVLWVAVGDNLDLFLSLPLGGIETAVARGGAAIEGLLWKGALVFLGLGCVDLWRQTRKHAAELRMSRQEIRDELKEAEGDPQTKARIRRIQRDLLRRKMMSQVPTATAVVVNPTHYAVALRYDMHAPGAPVVVAKGKNYLALRIKQKAIEHQVPVVENPPLAQTLYKSVQVGQEIPPALYRAVAEVLAYIYRVLNGRLPGGSR